ncbi:FtsK/SpoIIIE domain-containing protein [Microlunatus ginsengisoli]|uniref:FtsK domain-containing protein n=1 Tax=Microlunatus ginsengisoli TaxID=363863 RepID=A0ABP7ALD9_9ACTN
MGVRRSETTPSLLGSVLTVVVAGPALCLLLWWLGLPGAAAVWLAIIVRGSAVVPPELTGPRRDGRPTVGSELEQRRLDRYLLAVDLRDACLNPATLAPGWPVLASSLVAVLVGVLVWLVPQAWPVTRWVDGGLAALVVAAVAGSGRKAGGSGEPCPGTRVDTLPGLLARSPVRSVLLGTAGLLAGAAAAAVAVRVASLPVWSGLRRALLGFEVPGAGPLPWPAPLREFPSTPGWWFVVPAVLLGAVALLGPGWQRLALANWRALVRARAEWAERWAVVKVDPAPRLVDRHALDGPNGTVIVETFGCNPGHPADKVLALADRLRPTLGDDSVRLALLPLPRTDPATDEAVPGTASTLGFRAVRWPGGLVDITDPAVGQELVGPALESAMAWAAESTGWARMLLVGATRISRPPTLARGSGSVDGDEPAPEVDGGDGPSRGRQAWAVEWTSPIGMDMVQVRLNLTAPMAASLGCEVLADHRATGGRLHGQGVMYAGALTDGSARIDPDRLPAPLPAGVDGPGQMLENLTVDDWWVRVWAAVLGSDANPPTPKHNVRSTVTLPGGVEIVTQPFVVRQGQDPRDFFGREAKLTSAMDSMGFVAVTAFPDRSSNRPGERHPMAFQVHYSRGAVPRITALGPVPPAAALPLLAGRVNAAFRAARLAQPETYAVRCLTEPGSTGHIWEARVRLYDGVTLADLRARRKQLAITLGVPWLRIVEDGNDCRLVAGVDLAGARLGPQPRAELAAHDWEQVWRDARCTGADGALPALLSVRALPSNDAVSELVFRIPAGLDLARLRSAKGKLATGSENGFVEIGPGAEPSTVTVLAARTDPMPAVAPYRFGADPGEHRIAFADGIDGEPVAMDLTEVAHLLLVGTSGGGKTTAGQAIIQGALAGGAQVVVVDVQKGCADFRYAEPWCLRMAGDLADAAATMTALYAEVQRRRDLNAAHGVGSVHALPAAIRPPDVFVVVDEFFGLISSAERPATRSEPNPDLEAARLEALAAYSAKARIAYLAGRIGAEARSAGFHLVLMTQALTSKMRLPASIADLKVNSNRILLGKANHGERMSALRQPETAPDPGETVPRGRGVYEPVVGEARLVQFWYAPTGEYRTWLEHHVDKVAEQDRLDIEPHRMDPTAGAEFVITDERDGEERVAGARVVDGMPETAPVEVDDTLDLFDGLELPELVDDIDVDWSIVVGAEDGIGRDGEATLPGRSVDQPPGRRADREREPFDLGGGGPETASGPYQGGEPATGSAHDEDDQDGEDGWDDRPDARGGIRPARENDGADEEWFGIGPERGGGGSAGAVIRADPVDEEEFGDWPPRPPAAADRTGNDIAEEDLPDGADPGVDADPPVPVPMADPLAGLRRR